MCRLLIRFTALISQDVWIGVLGPLGSVGKAGTWSAFDWLAWPFLRWLCYEIQVP